MEKQVKKTLGRGIDALINPDVQKKIEDENNKNFSSIIKDNSRKVLEIAIENIFPNPAQPRQSFDIEKINELAASITQFGVLEPLLVTKDNDNQYFLVAGERRFRAAKIAGLKNIPCLELSISDEEKLEIAIIENLQRENLNPIETAQSFKDLMKLSKISQEDLAKRLSISRPVVSNFVRLLSLSEEIQEAIKTNKISQSHARLLLSVEDEEKRNNLFNKIVNEKLSVKSLEKNIKSKKTKEKNKKLSVYEEKLIEFFGTKVSVSGTFEKGNINIEYFNQEDFIRIINILNIDLE